MIGQLRSREEGSTLLETALGLPTACLFIFGLFYFSLVVFAYSGSVLGARASVRYAALHSGSSLTPATTASINSLAKACLIASRPGDVLVSTTYSPSASNVIGSTVQVSIKVSVPFFIPFMKGTAVTVGGSAQRTITR